MVKRSKLLQMMTELCYQVAQATIVICVASYAGFGPTVAASEEEHRGPFLEFVHRKYAYLLSSQDTGDPLVDAIQELSPRVKRIGLPPICRTAPIAYESVVVEVHKASHHEVRDVLVLSPSGEVLSLYEDKDMNAFLRELKAECNSAEDLSTLAILYLRLIYAPEDEEWKPARWCAVRPSSDEAVCDRPTPRPSWSGFRLNGDALAARHGWPPAWEHWEFRLRNGRFAAEVEPQ